MLASELSDDFEKEHGSALGDIMTALLPYFLAQTEWVVGSIVETEPLIIPEMIGMGFDPVQARAHLLDRMAVMQPIAERSALKAMNVITKPTTTIVTPTTVISSPTSPVGGIGATVRALPVSIIDAIKKLLERLWSLDWWQPVAEGQVKVARQIMTKTIAKTGPVNVKDVPKVKRKLKTRMRKVARVRTKAIATTEATTAVNMGRSEAGKAVSQAIGGGDEKTWVTMHDERVRPSHVALHMKSVPVNGDFTVGGYAAPHPGWWELPIHERIHCRCFLAYGGVEDDIQFELPEALREAV